jgi:hypothetical protein
VARAALPREPSIPVTGNKKKSPNLSKKIFAQSNDFKAGLSISLFL